MKADRRPSCRSSTSTSGAGPPSALSRIEPNAVNRPKPAPKRYCVPQTRIDGSGEMVFQQPSCARANLPFVTLAMRATRPARRRLAWRRSTWKIRHRRGWAQLKSRRCRPRLRSSTNGYKLLGAPEFSAWCCATSTWRVSCRSRPCGRAERTGDLTLALHDLRSLDGSSVAGQRRVHRAHRLVGDRRAAL